MRRSLVGRNRWIDLGHVHILKRLRADSAAPHSRQRQDITTAASPAPHPLVRPRRQPRRCWQPNDAFLPPISSLHLPPFRPPYRFCPSTHTLPLPILAAVLCTTTTTNADSAPQLFHCPPWACLACTTRRTRIPEDAPWTRCPHLQSRTYTSPCCSVRPTLPLTVSLLIGALMTPDSHQIRSHGPRIQFVSPISHARPRAPIE